MKKTTLILLSSVLLLSSCMTVAWVGYKKPNASSFISINDNSSCPMIGVQNLTETQKKAIVEASADVCEIFKSEEFKSKVLNRKWLASCETVNGHPDTINAQEVYNRLTANIPKYSIHPRHPWRAIAQTQKSELDIAYNRVAIKPKQIDKWYFKSDNLVTVDTTKVDLINTIAHEITHIVSYDFLDSGHGKKQCTDSVLVSYGIGNIVEEIWLARRKQ